jgi:tetratricopeptide (TPR) repeat protein
MPITDLKSAAADIHQIVALRKESLQSSPFFFIVGAGISHPPVPLAFDIENDCKATAARFGKTATPTSQNAIDSYSHWFHLAHPSPERVQAYLRRLMENLPISRANLRLAHILLDRSIASTVFTTNFDDMLTKALELFGAHPLVCDHPRTVTRMRVEANDIQIIHVHGSYWFYDCCNLTREIVQRSGDDLMSGALSRFLDAHSPIVVGYSGWEGDILMSALERRLKLDKLSTPIYWFCYERTTFDRLPKWLTHPEHGSEVYFVIPEETVQRASEGSGSSLKPDSVLTTIEPGAPDKSSETKPRTLPAVRVFDALVQSFDLSRPPLNSDPLSFFVNRLRYLLGSDLADTEPDTYYAFHEVIARITRGRDCEAKTGRSSLKAIRDAMSRADYESAIDSAAKVELHDLANDEVSELVLILLDASKGLNDKAAAEIRGYDLVVKASDLLAERKFSNTNRNERVAMALRSKGLRLGTLENKEAAIAVYDELLSRFADSTEPAIRAEMAMAMRSKGLLLGSLDRGQEEIEVYDELMRRFGDTVEPAIRAEVVMALRSKGLRLGTLNRNEECLATYDELLSRFAGDRDQAVRSERALAMLNKGYRLGVLGRSDEAIAVYEELLTVYGVPAETTFSLEVAMTLLNKGFRLGVLGRSEDEIAAYDELLRRFRNSSHPAVREQVAKALFNKGVTLGSLNRNEESIAVYDELIERFKDAPEPSIREQVAMGTRGKGLRLGTLNRHLEAIAVYDELIQRFSASPEPGIRAEVAMAFLNKGFRLGLLDRSEEEMAVYDELIERFGQSPEAALREQVAKALFNKGVTLATLNKNEQAIAVYDDLLRRFADAQDLALREQTAKALYSRGQAYAELGNKDLAVASYTEAISRFKDASEQSLIRLVTETQAQLSKFQDDQSSSS